MEKKNKSALVHRFFFCKLGTPFLAFIFTMLDNYPEARSESTELKSEDVSD